MWIMWIARFHNILQPNYSLKTGDFYKNYVNEKEKGYSDFFI